jgi:Ala-tRNA(Pro) deacylase
MDEKGLIDFLDKHGIPYLRFDHPAVFTVEEAEAALPNIPGAGTKNLFLFSPSRERFLLLMTLGEKRVDLKAFAATAGLTKIQFAPEEQLQEFLQVSRGGVTALGLINDTGKHVELWIDTELWARPSVHCHPLVNTATLVITTSDLKRFFALIGHEIHFVDVKEKI